MSRYRKVETRIWDDERFLGLSDRGKLVFLLLLTHPNMTMLGGMRASPGALAEDLRWPPETLREGFREVLSKGLAEHDEKARLVILPNFLKYNAPESPNVVKSWAKALETLPECKLKRKLIQRVLVYTESLSEAFRHALPQVFRNQEPEPEQKPKTPSKKGAKASGGSEGQAGLSVVNGGRS